MMIRDKRVGGFDCVYFDSWLPGTKLNINKTYHSSMVAVSKRLINRAESIVSSD